MAQIRWHQWARADADRLVWQQIITALAVVVLTGIGFGLRFYRVGTEALWIDELNTANFVAEHGPAWLLVELPQTQPHPPLYYIVLDAWVAVAGTSELALRFPSVVAGTLTIPAMYLAGRVYYGRATGVLAALLWAANPFAIYYSQEARMYALLGLLVATSYWLLERTAVGRGSPYTYLACAVAVAYTHVFGLFTLLAQGIYIAIRHHRGQIERLRPRHLALGVVGITPALAVPAFRVARSIFGWVVAAGTLHQVHHIDPPTVAALGRTILYWTVHRPVPTAPLFVGVGLPAMAIVLAVRNNHGGQYASRAVGVGTWVLVPMAVAYTLSHLVWPIYLPRYLIGAATGFVLAVAGGLAAFESYRPLVIGVLLASAAVQLPIYYDHTYRKPWDDAAAPVIEGGGCDETIAVAREIAKVGLQWYLPENCGDIVLVDKATDAPDARWYVTTNGGQSGLRAALADGRTETVHDLRNVLSVYEYR